MKAEGELLTAHVAAHSDLESVAELSYIAIDEIGDGLVTLIVSQSPSSTTTGACDSRSPSRSPSTSTGRRSRRS